jgi:hypothetical protein
MSFLSRFKNSLTGGWADVQLVVPGVVERGIAIAIQVRVKVKADPISINKVYVNIGCEERVDIPDYSVNEPGQPAGAEKSLAARLHIQKSENLYQKELVLAPEQQLQANQDYSFDGTLQIPGELPASYHGKNCKIEWKICASLDMKGNDPDSGWQTIVVQ